MALTQVNADPHPTTSAGVRSFITGSVIGAFVVFTLCAGPIMLFGGSRGGAVAVGVFCALWGGPGFGGMMGFVLHQDREERRRASAEGGGSSAPPRG